MNKNFEEMFYDFLKIYKFINRDKITTTLGQELSDEKTKKIYSLTNGENSIRDIVSVVGASKSTIASLWKKWSLLAMVEPAGRKGRVKAVFDLHEYGLMDFDETDFDETE